jgi:O-antigen/teichoic acid export membrane protein
MKFEFKTLGKHTLVYGAGIIIGKAVSFIMLPIYTRYLTPADYGVLELLIITIDVFSMVTGMGLTATIFRYYAKYENQEEKNHIISTALIMMFIASLTIGTPCIYLSGKLSHLVFSSDQYDYYFKLMFMSFILQAGIEIPLAYIRAKQNSTLFVLINFCRLVLQLSLNIYLVVFLKMGVLGILYSSFMVSLVACIYLGIYTIRTVGCRFSLLKSIEMIKFGSPLILWSLGSLILTFSDRYFLNIYSNLNTVGIYALAYKFGFLLTALAVDPFSLIWEPHRFQIAKQENAVLIYKKVFFYQTLILVSLSFLIAVVVKDVLKIMSDPSYWEAYKLVPIILLAYILQAWTAFCNIGLFIKEKTNIYALSAGIAVVCVTLLNLFLIPKFGAYGAAWATVGAFLIRFIIVYNYSQREYFIDYGWGKVLKLTLIAGFLYLVRLLEQYDAFSISISTDIVIILLFSILVYYAILEDEAKMFIKKMLQRPIYLSALLHRKA